ncbi:SurA N-terminal domain-containing protein [Candidatus Microgenomates bacterium]|nr:SurA N-terminal domain-containing protein [Candidatus Microgenomates bacterium]
MIKEVKPKKTTKTIKKPVIKAKTTQKKSKKFKLKFNLKINERAKRILIGLLTVLIIALLIFRFKHLFIATIVNNQIITRYSLNQELEKQAGEQVLETLVTKTLILQEAKKQGIKISQEDLDKKISEIEEELKSQGADLETLLLSQGQTRESFEEQLKIQLMIDEMLGKEVTITEEEIKTYFEENKDALGEEAVFEEVKEDLETQIKQGKIRDQFRPWLTEVEEKAKVYQFLKF